MSKCENVALKTWSHIFPTKNKNDSTWDVWKMSGIFLKSMTKFSPWNVLTCIEYGWKEERWSNHSLLQCWKDIITRLIDMKDFTIAWAFKVFLTRTSIATKTRKLIPSDIGYTLYSMRYNRAIIVLHTQNRTSNSQFSLNIITNILLQLHLIHLHFQYKISET